MSGVVEFLEARIAEDEADAINRVVLRTEDRRSLTMDEAERAHRECAAKRGILDDYTGSPATFQILMHMAAVYQDHPDYLQEWAP